MIKKILLSPSFLSISGVLFLLFSSNSFGQVVQGPITRIHTDWKGYWTANGATTGTNRPDLENNLIGFEWNGTTYSTGVDDATLISKVPTATIQKFRALKIQSLSYTSSTYFLQGAMIDGSATGRTLNPLLSGATSTPAELASRLTDGKNGLALGTGIANIDKNKVYFKVGTGNLNVFGLNDNIPDLIVTQVAEPGGTPDVFRFVDVSGNLVGNAISINFSSVNRVGSYSLDLFNASNGAIASSFTAQETRDIRILGYDTSAFGIDANNAAQVDRFEVSFSGNSDCAFIAFNANSLKKAELSLVKTAVVSGCGAVNDKINYSFVVKNTGDVPITNVIVTDPMTGIVISGTQGSALNVNESITLTGIYTITAADVIAGRVANSAKVTGIDPSLNTVEDVSGTAENNDVATVTNLLTAPTVITGITAICKGGSTTLTVSGGNVGSGATVEWFTGSCGGTSVGTGNSITVSPTSNTTYYVRYRRTCDGVTTACASQLITVNPNPTLATVTQPTLACDGSSATINLTGLLVNRTSTITYTINGGSTQTVTGVVSDGSGSASFTTGVLNTSNNGQILQITGITTTSAAPSCIASFTRNVTLNVNSNSGTLSINGESRPTGNVTYCPSTLATFSIPAVSGATYTWIVPTGWKTAAGVAITGPVTGSSNELKVITGTTAESGSVTVTVNTFCPSNLLVALSGIAPAAPTVTPTGLTCAVPTGAIKVTSPPPAAGTVYTLTGINPAVAAVANTSGEFSGLAAGDYVVTYQQGSGCVSTPTSTISLTPLLTKTWNAGWSPAGVPSINDYVVFAGDYDKLGSVNACSCKVNIGATVTVKSGDVFVIENGLDVAGNMVFEHGASLVQNNPLAVNSGSITYRRSSGGLKAYDYVYWSSPVENQTLGSIFPGSNKMWFYQEDLWYPASGPMAPAKGYIVRYSSATSQNAEFVGKPNNGDYLIPTQASGNNLIGNPYPSAIDADSFMIDNIAVIDGGLSFWTHNTARAENGTDTKYIYATNDYAMYTFFGASAAGSGGAVPDGTIASGQSFFVPSSGGSFSFANTMRIKTTGKNSQFFKQTTTKKGAKIEKDRAWLNLTNDQGAFKQLLVGYATGATNGFDKLYDAKTLNGNAYIDFYSIEGSINYTIQARGLPSTIEDEVVQLGFKTAVAGTFQIALDKSDGALKDQAIYIEDKTTNTIHDLKSGAYSFATTVGEFKDRFVLRYNNDSKLGTGDFDPNSKGVIVSVKNRQIKINSFDQSLTSVKVYDLKGSLVYEKNKVNSNEFIIGNLASATQFMVVMIQLEDGKWVTEEIIFHD